MESNRVFVQSFSCVPASHPHRDVQVVPLAEPQPRESLASPGFLPIARISEGTPLSTRGVESLPTQTDGQFFTISGELNRNVSLIRLYKPLAELEDELFNLCKEFAEEFHWGEISLESVEVMYPVAQLIDTDLYENREEWSGLEEEIVGIIEENDGKLVSYRWIERVVRFLNMLSMKWELVDTSRYRYRNVPVPSDPLRLHQYKLRQVWVFPMEILWMACKVSDSPLREKLSAEVVELGQLLRVKTVELIRRVVSLNFQVNFKHYPSVSRDLGMLSEEERLFHSRHHKSQVDPHLMSTMGLSYPDLTEVIRAVGQPTLENAARQLKAKLPTSRNDILLRHGKQREVGVHLLELPHILLKCLERGEKKGNLELKEKLQEYERVFRVFDMQITAFLMLQRRKNREEQGKLREKRLSEGNLE